MSIPTGSLCRPRNLKFYADLLCHVFRASHLGRHGARAALRFPAANDRPAMGNAIDGVAPLIRNPTESARHSAAEA